MSEETKRRVLAATVVALFALPLIYGFNLYFSVNRNLNDPVVLPLVPITKDAFLATLVLAYVAARWRDAVTLVSRADVLCLGIFVVSASILAIALFGIDRSTLSFSKNLMLYLFGSYVAGALLIRHLGSGMIGWALFVALCISLIVSVLLMLHPVQSYDGRMYGTYGNPTSLGFAGIALAGLALWRARDRIAATIACAALSVMTGSASVILGTCVLFLGVAALEMSKGRSSQMPLNLLTVYIASFLAIGFTISSAGLPAFGFDRLAQFANAPLRAIATSDSWTIRVMDLSEARASTGYHRYDSFLLSIWRNFGWLPILGYVGFLCAVGYAFLASAWGYRDVVMIVLFGVLFAVNPMLQHQLEIFPTNGLFAVVAAMAASQFLTSPGSCRSANGRRV